MSELIQTSSPLPAPTGWEHLPAPPPSGPARPERRRGLIGSLLAVLAGGAKYGVALLKVGKFGPTLISMVLSLGALTLFYGPAFAPGLLALTAAHEFGHLLSARREGVAVGMPVFLGPLGAVIGLRQPPRDARQEAVIAIGGPGVGNAGALAVLLWGLSLPDGYLHGLLVSLAYFGFFLNLFNLVPMSPLDGGRVASALSRWANVLGLAVIAGLVVVMIGAGTLNPFLLLILL